MHPTFTRVSDETISHCLNVMAGINRSQYADQNNTLLAAPAILNSLHMERTLLAMSLAGEDFDCQAMADEPVSEIAAATTAESLRTLNALAASKGGGWSGLESAAEAVEQLSAEVVALRAQFAHTHLTEPGQGIPVRPARRF